MTELEFYERLRDFCKTYNINVNKLELWKHKTSKRLALFYEFYECEQKGLFVFAIPYIHSPIQTSNSVLFPTEVLSPNGITNIYNFQFDKLEEMLNDSFNVAVRRLKSHHLRELCENLQSVINKLEDITERSLPLKKAAIISDLNLLRKIIVENKTQDVNLLFGQIDKISSYVNSHL